MSESRCEIVFRGKILAGFDRDRVRTNLAQLLGIAAAQVDDILDAPKTVLKSGLDRTAAAEFRESLLRAGIMVAVITLPSAAPAPAPLELVAMPDAPGPRQHVVAAHLGPSALALSDHAVALAPKRPFEAPRANTNGLRISKSSEHVAAQPAPASVIKALDLTVAETERREEKVQSKLIEAITKDARNR